MPKLGVRTEKRQTSGSPGTTYMLVRLEGLIDAPNFLAFEATLEKLQRANEVRAVLDFRGVQYINSTGISSIIRFHTAFQERGGTLLLIQVARNVGLTMHLLGVTSIVPFLKGLPDAERYLDERRTGPPPDPDLVDADSDEEDGGPRRVPVLAEAGGKDLGTVVLVIPGSGQFTTIFRKRLAHLNGNHRLLHSIDELEANLDQLDPDLVVLDHRLSGVDQFIERLKTEPRHSLTSVLVLYERGSDIQRFDGFRVWENDYLVDPFELMNLFALTERELQRVPRDRQVLVQQVQFQFNSDESSTQRGLQLASRLIHGLGLPETETTALYAAFKEAVDNAILHGNRHRDSARVTVNLLVDSNKVTFIVEDEGTGFDYEFFLSQMDNEEAFERAKQRIRAGGRGGLGILLMHKCADRLEYSGSGNILRLEKNLPKA